MRKTSASSAKSSDGNEDGYPELEQQCLSLGTTRSFQHLSNTMKENRTYRNGKVQFG